MLTISKWDLVGGDVSYEVGLGGESVWGKEYGETGTVPIYEKNEDKHKAQLPLGRYWGGWW